MNYRLPNGLASTLYIIDQKAAAAFWLLNEVDAKPFAERVFWRCFNENIHPKVRQAALVLPELAPLGEGRDPDLSEEALAGLRDQYFHEGAKLIYPDGVEASYEHRDVQTHNNNKGFILDDISSLFDALANRQAALNRPEYVVFYYGEFMALGLGSCPDRVRVEQEMIGELIVLLRAKYQHLLKPSARD